MIDIREWNRDGYTVSSDPSRLQLAVIHGFLTNCYWAEGIPAEIVLRSIEGSIPFGVYHGGEQVGFARIVSDQATFAYVADVFVLEPYRGKGLARWLMQCILETPELQGLRRWLLMTRDAHALYQAVGFSLTKWPERVMEISRPNPYRPNPDPTER
jgi:GNAT superfamily N-acetyltransferase